MQLSASASSEDEGERSSGDCSSSDAAGNKKQTTSSKPIPPIAKRKRRSQPLLPEDPVAKEVMGYLSKKPDPDDEDGLFVLSLVPALKRLAPQQWLKFRQNITRHSDW